MYSLDFRKQVVSALSTRSIRQVAADFGISRSTIQLWKKDISSKASNIGRQGKIDTDALIKDVEAYLDAYHYERASRFNCNRSAITRCLKRLNINKKTAQHPSACPVKRSHFYLCLAAYQQAGRPLVYLDESGFRVDYYRPYGYAPKGKCGHNWQLKNTTNALAAWCNEKILVPCLVESNINADVFLAWVTHCLLPELPQKSVIIMDNATFHKRSDILETIAKAGHQILWLPPYSPDLNPIEEVWAWLKSLRKNGV